MAAQTGKALVDRYQNETLIGGNPLAYYRMREGSGTTMTDYTAVPFTGTYNGSGVSWINSVAGQSGKGGPLWNVDQTIYNRTPPTYTSTTNSRVMFDGTAGRATSTLTGINTANGSVVTAEFWMKWDGNMGGSTGAFEAMLNFGGATGLLLGLLKNGASDYRFGLSVRNTGDLWGIDNGRVNGLLERDVWHHIVFVIVNNAVQTSSLYIDGDPITMSQQIGTSTTTKAVTSAFAIGYDGTASFFQGQIAETAIYNYGFSAQTANNKFHIGAYGGIALEQMASPGIESQIDFGLSGFYGDFVKLNEREVGTGRRLLDTYVLTDIGGLDDADIRFSEEPNTSFNGMNPMRSLVGGRTITLEGFIDATNLSSLRQLQARLKQQLGGSGNLGANPYASGLQEFNMIFRSPIDNAWDQQINVRKSAPLQMKEAQADAQMRRQFMATLRASYPFFESVGSRTEVLQMGATVPIFHKGSAISLPIINFYGPFSKAELDLGNALVVSGTLLASQILTVDCRQRSCSNWAFYNPSSDFPFINGYAEINLGVQGAGLSWAVFASITGGTVGVTRVEITWRHTNL